MKRRRGYRIFMRLVLSPAIGDDAARTMLTSHLLFTNGSWDSFSHQDLKKILERLGEHTLDVGLVRQAFQECDLKHIAMYLQSLVGHLMQTDELRHWFEHVYSSSNDPETLWRAASGLHDHLRHHPGALPIPLSLIEALEKADDSNAKGMGVKLIVNVPELIPDYRELLQRSLENVSDLVQLNALFVLVEGLDRLLRQAHLPANIRDVLSLQGVIESIQRSSTDEARSTMSRHALSRLDDIRERVGR